MRYILNRDIALRSWQRVPFSYYRKGLRDAARLTKDEFYFLILCDGKHDLPENELSKELINRGLIHPTTSESLTDWQKAHYYNNRYFPAVNWMITGRCNFNCLHCFNATDNARLQSEFTLDEAEKLISEAEKCGINGFTITGGEPMIHPHFIEIIKSIYAHEMYVYELNTNGYFLTQEVLNELKEIGCHPLMKISFDGIGHHDWLRNRIGAEKEALAAIKLCVENGFDVKAQTNVHRLNLDSIFPTALLLDSLGVREMRIIRTTEAPRWLENAGDSCLSIEEYFDSMLAFCSKYIKTDCSMDIDIWQFLHVFKKEKQYHPRAIEYSAGEYRDTFPVCKGNRGMVAIAANGNLFPCHQMSGYYEKRNDILGNVKTDGLQKLLSESKYLSEVCTTVKTLKEQNPECASCEWFPYCCGGCRAIALALTGDKLGVDPSKCLFFRKGYPERLKQIFKGYKCTVQTF
jgi:radical SAM protein with 4Fe4S-binding SPASM domain